MKRIVQPGWLQGWKCPHQPHCTSKRACHTRQQLDTLKALLKEQQDGRAAPNRMDV